MNCRSFAAIKKSKNDRAPSVVATPEQRRDAMAVLRTWQETIAHRDALATTFRRGSKSEKASAQRKLTALYTLIEKARGRPSLASLRTWLAPPQRPKHEEAFRVYLAHRFTRVLLGSVEEFERQAGPWESILEVDFNTTELLLAVVGEQRFEMLEAAIREVIANPDVEKAGSWHDAIRVLEAIGVFKSDSTIKRRLREHAKTNVKTSANSTSGDTGASDDG